MVDHEAKRKAKRKERQSKTAEVFTPAWLVDEMLDKLPEEVWEKGKTFLDPACGNGNFLIAVLYRKIQKGHNPLQSLNSIYGVDIMPDNIQECRIRLLKFVSFFQTLTLKHVAVVLTNIYIADALAYDFEFNKVPTEAMCKKYWNMVQEKELLEKVSVPTPNQNL